jgi:DNA-binding HxlR family transcriptional regulator
MFKELDPLLHSQLRLAMVSYLVSKGESSDFNELKAVTKATSGNLCIQLKTLEGAGYVKVKKGYRKNYPHTSVEVSKTGIEAFEDYVEALKGYIG